MRREHPAGLSRTRLSRTRPFSTRPFSTPHFGSPHSRTRHSRTCASRTRPGGAAWAVALLAGALAVLLLAPAAAPAGTGGDVDRERAARVARAHEKARARVDRLRETDADAPRVEAAERHREALRAHLWDLLWERARALGDPVAVDPSGQARRCAARDGGHLPASAGDDTGTAWTTPTRDYWLSAGYADQGAHWAHRHTGQDFAVAGGTPVYAVGPGVVRATTCGDGFGHQVLVRHPDGYFTQYAHLSRVDVRTGQRVEAGRRLGLAGATGNVTGPHLHFEVRITPYMGSAVPPLPWLVRKGVEVVEAVPGG